MQTPEIISIVSLIITTLLGGGGWYRAWRKAKRTYKRGFLIPLHSLLKQNKKIFDELTEDIDLKKLEYAPDYIQRKYKNLDDTNPLKRLWRSRFETLMENNQRAIQSINANIGYVENKELKAELEEFISHAQKFNDIWRMIPADEEIKPGIDIHCDLMGEKYPDKLDSLLEQEIGT
jgi:hypothetical protein